MATAKPLGGARLGWLLRALLAIVVLAAGVSFFFGEVIAGYGAAGTSYAAKNACSCRYVGGRDLDSCKTDMLSGMEAVFLSEDERERSVTAYIPLIDSTTARFEDGPGCMLDAWE